MFTIEELLRISNQMRDYYAKKIKDSFQEFNFSPNEISILIVLKKNDSGNLKITNLDRLIFTKNGEFTI